MPVTTVFHVAAIVEVKSLLLQVFSIIGCQPIEEFERKNELMREVFDKRVVEGVVTYGNILNYNCQSLSTVPWKF